MLITAKQLKGYKLQGRDGQLGAVKEFYFDDRHWTVRYIVADTGNWLTGRTVLLSPHAFGQVEVNDATITVNLSKKEVEDSPALESNKPVSRQYEEAYYGHYGWPVYWGGSMMWGAYPYIVHDRETEAKDTTEQPRSTWNPNLRSTNAVIGNHVHAADGDVGHVEDFLLDAETWAIRYLLVDTRNWLPGKSVLISPNWVERVSWDDAKVFVKVKRDAIKSAPEYDPTTQFNREYETGLHTHYNSEGYWVTEERDRSRSRTP